MTNNQELIKQVDDLRGALRFILAFYEPGQRHLDTNAWKVAEAAARHHMAKTEGLAAALAAVIADEIKKGDDLLIRVQQAYARAYEDGLAEGRAEVLESMKQATLAEPT